MDSCRLSDPMERVDYVGILGRTGRIIEKAIIQLSLIVGNSRFIFVLPLEQDIRVLTDLQKKGSVLVLV